MNSFGVPKLQESGRALLLGSVENRSNELKAAHNDGSIADINAVKMGKNQISLSHQKPSRNNSKVNLQKSNQTMQALSEPKFFTPNKFNMLYQEAQSR